MLVPGQLATLMFHIGVTVMAIIPRLPNDRPFPSSIGGDLSFPFRRVMIGLVISNTIRILCFQDPRFIVANVNLDDFTLLTRLDALSYHVLKALESFLRSFLCLLTPYLMQCQLQNRINISQPGQDLMRWVYLVVVVSFVGCLLVELTNDTRYWCIKELGDALSFPPVYKTLKLYSSVVALGGRYPKRGDMTVQTLLVVEYLAVFSTFLSAVGYIYMNDPRPMFPAFRSLGAYVNLTRLLCHAMLMNSKDEAAFFSKYASTNNGNSNNNSGNTNTTHSTVNSTSDHSDGNVTNPTSSQTIGLIRSV